MVTKHYSPWRNFRKRSKLTQTPTFPYRGCQLMKLLKPFSTRNLTHLNRPIYIYCTLCAIQTRDCGYNNFGSCFDLGRKLDFSRVEIKCQLDATDNFYCRSYCLIDMFRAPLFPSSGAREYYTSGCCLQQQPANRTHNPQLQTIPTTWKPKHQIRQAATTCIILSSSWWWA